MTLTTRPPTGQPPWPLVLLAGGEKTGKSYACASASASDLIGRTFWVAFGERDPDELGALPGARFEIVQHDGTRQGLLQAIDAVAATPPGEDGRPHLLVIDSGTRVWDLLKDETQAAAWRRAKAKADRRREGFDKALDEVEVGRDLWNLAAQRWDHFMDAVRGHRGPVIITARLDEVSGTDAAGQPTREKTWKVQGHKSLPFDVDAIVELRAYRQALIRGVRSLRWQAAPDALVPAPDFTVEKLWSVLGLAEAGERRQTRIDADASVSAGGDTSSPTGVARPVAASGEPDASRRSSATRPATVPTPDDPAELSRARGTTFDALVRAGFDPDAAIAYVEDALGRIERTPTTATLADWQALLDHIERQAAAHATSGQAHP